MRYQLPATKPIQPNLLEYQIAGKREKKGARVEKKSLTPNPFSVLYTCNPAMCVYNVQF